MFQCGKCTLQLNGNQGPDGDDLIIHMLCQIGIHGIQFFFSGFKGIYQGLGQPGLFFFFFPDHVNQQSQESHPVECISVQIIEYFAYPGRLIKFRILTDHIFFAFRISAHGLDQIADHQKKRVFRIDVRADLIQLFLQEAAAVAGCIAAFQHGILPADVCQGFVIHLGIVKIGQFADQCQGVSHPVGVAVAGGTASNQAGRVGADILFIEVIHIFSGHHFVDCRSVIDTAGHFRLSQCQRQSIFSGNRSQAAVNIRQIF